MRHRADDPISGRLYRSSQYPEVPDMTDPSSYVPVDRPNPLRDAARSVSTGWAGLSGLVGALVTFGAITTGQADAINAFGTALPGWLMALGVILGAVVPAATTLLASFSTAKAGRDKVTPLVDPRDVDGHRLVRADGAPLGGAPVTTPTPAV